jgi:hypothetical protein
MKKIFISTSVSLLLILLFAGWGSTGHKIINGNIYVCLPPVMNLPATWNTFLVAHASDPDSRKGSDPTEDPRHFIDIDAYPEFVTHGFISQNYDSVVALHTSSWVINQGTVPWAIVRWEDSLKKAFQQLNWSLAMQLSADLGHYVGDGHQPLHITENYDGKMTNQSGVHSRYETSLVGQYQSSIVYTNDKAVYIPDVSNYDFSFIYVGNSYVDSVLYGDSVAHAVTGTTSGSAYLTKYWELAGAYTINLMKNASKATADLIYTAWVDAGSPNSLPVELVSFTSAVQKNNVTLSWATATEINNRGFEIEKKINSSWNTIGFISGKGTTSEKQNYSFADNNLKKGTYEYRLKQVDFNGQNDYSNSIMVEITGVTGFELSQNFPNPFNPSTLIRYNIPQKGNVSLKVYDVTGKEVADLVNSEKEAGSYEINFDASRLSSGVYFYEVRSGSFFQAKKMILTK